MFHFSQKFAAARRRMRRDTRGVVSIEYAFIAPVFFLLLLGIIETGVLFYSQNTLLYATQNAGRLVRTGAAQGTTYTTAAVCAKAAPVTGGGGSGAGGSYKNGQEWFKDQICCGISGLLTDCNALNVSVQNYAAGFGSSFSDPPDANGNLQPVTDSYNPGAPCDVVLLRATYSWPVVTPLMTKFLSNMAGGMHLLSATMAFRNEPYTAGAAC